MLQVVLFQDQNVSGDNNPQPNEWAMPESVDLHKSGLWCLLHLAALHSSEPIASHSTIQSEPIVSHSTIQSEPINFILTSSETSLLPTFSWMLHPSQTTLPYPLMTSLLLLSSWLLHPSKMKILKARGRLLLSSKQMPTFYYQIWRE
jgi:hypothetical protein